MLTPFWILVLECSTNRLYSATLPGIEVSDVTTHSSTVGACELSWCGGYKKSDSCHRKQLYWLLLQAHNEGLCFPSPSFCSDGRWEKETFHHLKWHHVNIFVEPTLGFFGDLLGLRSHHHHHHHPAPHHHHHHPVPHHPVPTHSNCSYYCSNNGGCVVDYVGPSRPGKTSGSCFPHSYGGGCGGTPPECSNCNSVLTCHEPGVRNHKVSSPPRRDVSNLTSSSALEFPYHLLLQDGEGELLSRKFLL